VAVLQNLGSAYFRSGDEGRAILAFERALLLKPGDPDLKANLKLVRDQAAVFPPPPAEGWRSWLERPSRKFWSGLALASALLLPVAAGLWLGLRSRWRGAARSRRLRASSAPISRRRADASPRSSARSVVCSSSEARGASSPRDTELR
jgi:hypothetical protein